MALASLGFVVNGAVAQAQNEAAAPVAQNGNVLVLDNFENGVAGWTRNDKVKTDNPAAGVVLVDLVSTPPADGGLPGSSGAALFAFKDAKDSWASASLRINGSSWAKIGAQRLTFWLNADGAQQGTDLVLRGTYKDSTGVDRDEAFTIPVRLNVRSWRRVVVPLADIKNANGTLLSRLNNIYLLQFVQRGSWSSRFFTVDQLQVEGTGKSLAQPVAAKTPTPRAVPTPLPADPNATQVSVDFLKKQGRVRTVANVSIGSSVPSESGNIVYPLQDNEQFRKAITTLSPRFVRLEATALSELVDSL
ncbi:MAG TPA: hypothetical protein VF719_12595, partial [Abditibacteriaceae bacterium]